MPQQDLGEIVNGSEAAPAKTSRRGFKKSLFIVGLAAAVAGCATVGPSIRIKPEAVVDLTETLRKNQILYPRSSGCAPVVNIDWRQDFQGHLRREPHKVGIAGIDFDADANTTIVAADDGYVVWVNPKQNHVIIDHGFRYRTLYGHVLEINVKINQYVQRGEPVGKGGGTNGSKYTHNHLTLYGPAYFPHLKGINIQDTNDTKPLYRYAIDPEPFSALERCFPYSPKKLADFLNKPLIGKVKDAQQIVYKMFDQLKKDELDMLEKADLSSLFERDRFSEWYWRNKGIDMYLDRKMEFLYRQVNKEKPPFNDANSVTKGLVELMKTMVPILTAPVGK
ncbi:M23 family metallopeptidase [Candidatus Woesearchaeota archaeon]|nr:M23 family metallopeptidase [Candidatus Woesearchaeota archaeon]